jgi:uncharacterized metal-binding protein
MIEIALCANAKLSEIFCCLWHCFCEYLEHDCALCSAPIFTILTYFYIKEALGILWVKIFQVWMILWFIWLELFFVVHSFLEETLNDFLVRYAESFLRFFNLVQMISQVFVVGLQLDCFYYIILCSL